MCTRAPLQLFLHFYSTATMSSPLLPLLRHRTTSQQLVFFLMHLQLALAVDCTCGIISLPNLPPSLRVLRSLLTMLLSSPTSLSLPIFVDCAPELSLTEHLELHQPCTELRSPSMIFPIHWLILLPLYSILLMAWTNGNMKQTPCRFSQSYISSYTSLRREIRSEGSQKFELSYPMIP